MSTKKQTSNKKSSAASVKTSKKSSKVSAKAKVENKVAQSPEMTAEKYADISLKIMPKILKVLIPKIETLSETMGNDENQNPFEAMGKIMAVMMEAFGQFEGEFQSLGTSGEVFNTWGNTHKEEMDAYFATNPEIQKKIVEFQNQMQEIMASIDKQKSPEISEAAPDKGLTMEKAVPIMVKIMQKSFDLLLQKWDKVSKTIKPENKQRELGKLMGEIQTSSQIEAEYQALGTNAKEFDAWMKEHMHKLDDYLATQPALKKKMDEYKSKFNELAQK